MKRLLFPLLALAFPLSGWAEGSVRLNITFWHLTPATGVVTTYGAACRHRVYTFTATTSPDARRAGTIHLAIQDGTASRAVDLTQTALGRLMTDPTGFGELRFACRPNSLFAFYRGATLASETSNPVVQHAVFVLSPEGEVSIPPPEGITETPLR